MKKKCMSLRTLRDKADEINLQVKKGFQHCRDAVIYDANGNRQTGFMVKDLATGCFVKGCYNECYDYLWDIDTVAEYLKERYEVLGIDW